MKIAVSRKTKKRRNAVLWMRMENVQNVQTNAFGSNIQIAVTLFSVFNQASNNRSSKAKPLTDTCTEIIQIKCCLETKKNENRKSYGKSQRNRITS